jgi:hypothetical protein
MSSLVVCPHCKTRVLPMAGRLCPACRNNVDTPPADPPAGPPVEALHAMAAEQMIQGAAPSVIQENLAKAGLDAGAAAHVVNELKQARAEAQKVAAQKNMFYGAFWCIGGIAVTVLTYQAASDMGGGRFIIAWGAALVGAIQFLRGLTQLSGE